MGLEEDLVKDLKIEDGVEVKVKEKWKWKWIRVLKNKDEVES